MATKLSEGLGEQVTCPICLEHYSDPRLLPCLHTYCRQCLQDLLAKGKRKVSVICPECREEVQIISGDVVKLKVNFWIDNLLSLLAIHSTDEKDGDKTELTCENCDSKAAAKGRCINCCMFLCNVCFTAHQRLLALKDHQLITLDELKDTGIPVIEKQLFCTKHKGEVMKLFCNTCQKLVCRDCAIIDHRDHDFSFIKDVATDYKENLKQKMRRASNIDKNVEAVLKSVREMKGKVEMASKRTEKDVDDLIDKQIKVLEEKRDTLKEEARSMAAEKVKELVTQEDGLLVHLTSLKSAIEFTGKLLENGSDGDVLNVSHQVESRLSQLSEKPFATDPCQEDKIRLRVDHLVLSDSIERFAVVIDAITPDPNHSMVTPVTVDLIERYGIFYAKNGQVLEFIACIKNAFGDKLRFMGKRIKVKAWSVCSSNPRTFDIKSHSDCTYSFVLEFGDVPSMDVRVMVDGESIQRSPILIKSLKTESNDETNIVGDEHAAVCSDRHRHTNSRRNKQMKRIEHK